MKSSRYAIPRPLPRGAIIGVFSPAGPPVAERVQRGVSRIEALGYRCLLADDALGAYEYFSAPDDLRLASFNKLLADPKVDAMMMTRGGYGISRIVHRIDWEAVAKSGKVLCGFSDFTAINLAAIAKGNYVTLAGSGVATDFGDEIYEGQLADDHTFMEQHFWPILLGEPVEVDVALAHRYIAQTINGPIWGSNLSLVSDLVGTPFMPNIAGGILFLEEIGERPYAAERMIWQLFHAGILQKQCAILVGDFNDCEPEANRFPYSMSHVVNTLRGIVDCPVLTNFPFGHIARKLTIPFGADATLTIADGRYSVSF
ncbi:MAG: LD-carboxypeptidase [Burkholderiales bacterium]|jgi:muramoyltetrapeptide carboxypeptidase|nr:LD-carboxypeptidase [Betaproteobacteria bacterium]